ncbi:Sensor protein TorS [bioreactor metagenome]|uniref:Sensor protein TorS n=1 Tax=bioreactor metagenome TaxID=1076179 RepID=A0A645FTV0_9ZZZZ
MEFLRIDEEHGTLRVRVADTGVGIRPEAQERIFLPFVQQDAARDSRLFNGTGLGLAISRRLAIGMGGTLRVESVPGAGSCFILEFPTACTDLKPQKAEEPDWEGEALSGRILLVDDVPMNQRVLQTMAEKLGCSCCIAGSGAEALRILDREKNFDLVLTDLWMPEMNGTELAGKVAEKTGGATPVIAVTADTQIATGLSVVFDGVLLKPITPRMLGNAIRKAKRKRKTDETN